MQAAARSAESMTGQNLRRGQEVRTPRGLSDWSAAQRSRQASLVSPERLRVLSQRQQVHDGDEDKLAGVVDDGQDGGEVVRAPAGRDLRRGALQEAPEAWTNQRGGAGVAIAFEILCIIIVIQVSYLGI